MLNIPSLLSSCTGAHICFVGGPCLSGKSTRAELAALALQQVGIVYLDTSAVIRGEIDSGSDLGLVFAEHQEHCRQGGLQPDEETMIAVFQHAKKGIDSGNRLVLIVGTPRTPKQAKWIIQSRLDFSLVQFQADNELLEQNLARRREQGRPDDEFFPKRMATYKKKTRPALTLLRRHRPSSYYELEASPRGLRKAVTAIIGICLKWEQSKYGKIVNSLNSHRHPVGQEIRRLMVS